MKPNLLISSYTVGLEAALRVPAQLAGQQKKAEVARLVFTVICLCLFLATLSPAQNQSTVAGTTTTSSMEIPRLVRFSGTVRDAEGNPSSGVAGITFALYKDQQGGAPLWLETQNVHADSTGKYTVLLGLGSAEGLPMDIFTSNDARWLGIQVEGQAEQPRTLLVSAPYALKAGDAETLGGKPLSAFQLVTPQSSNDSGAKQQNATPAAEQPNEIACASGTACKSAFIPLFASNGGSARVSDSIITQTGSTVNVSGEVVGQTGFFRSGNSGAIFQATQTNHGGGVGVAGAAEGTSGVGVQGSGFLGVVGQGLGDGATAVVGQAFGSGTGVRGSSTATSGVNRGVEGDVASTSDHSVAVFGEAQGSTGQTIGVEGFNFANTDFASGVSGFADGDQNKTFGVTGRSFSPNGTGLWGLGQGQSVIGQHVGCCGPVGVWGDTSSSAPGAAGLVGTADDGFALVLENNSADHLTANIVNDTKAPGVAILTVLAKFFNQFCNINTNGDLRCTGMVSGVVPVNNGQRQVALHAVESPQNWFEDFGNGRLESGVGRVALEPTFAQTVNTASDYHVFLTPRGECRGLYVGNTSATGFEVHELGGGQSNVAFDYRIVALRRGYENARLEDETAMVAKMKDSVPKPTATPTRWTRPVLPKPFSAAAIPAN